MTIFSSRPARWELRGLGNGPRAFGFHGPGGRFRRFGTPGTRWDFVAGSNGFFSIEKRQFDVEYLVEYIYISSEKWRILRTIPSYGIYILYIYNIYNIYIYGYMWIYIYGSYPWNSIMNIYCMEYISSFGSKIHNFPRGFCDARPDQFQSLVLWGVGSEG